jgi:hypothetical protein
MSGASVVGVGQGGCHGAMSDTGAMTSHLPAELSALASTVADVQTRVSAIAQRYQDGLHDDLVSVLHEGERSLRAAIRSLERSAKLSS